MSLLNQPLPTVDLASEGISQKPIYRSLSGLVMHTAPALTAAEGRLAQ
jgi:hypothetical protein